MDNINDFLKLYKWPILLIFVGVVLILGGIFSSGLRTKIETKKEYPPESLRTGDYFDIKVDISGAVLHPGVYTIYPNARLEDVVILAGGFIESANSEFIAKSVNLSAKVLDGEKIYIPFQGESGVLSVESTSTQRGKININTALANELESLPGIGIVTANAIINSRPYNDISDLLNKKAVSKSVFSKIKDLIVVR